MLRTAAEGGEQLNGYQVIQQIGERSGGAWKPSPGSVYPTIQLLHDEGLLETDDEMGRKSLRLTALGATYVTEHAEELAAVWRPFDRTDSKAGEYADLKPEIGQVMGAVWQIVTQGSESQRQAAVDVLVDTRRKLYGILADGDDAEAGDADDGHGVVSDALRIGDAEREQAAADLGEHFAQGRLSVDEHAERLEQVWVAKTRAELVPLFRDLPGGAYGARPAGPAPAPPGHGRSDRPWRRRRFPVPVFAIIGLLVLIAVVTHAPFLFFGVLILWCVSRGPRRHAFRAHSYR